MCFIGWDTQGERRPERIRQRRAFVECVALDKWIGSLTIDQATVAVIDVVGITQWRLQQQWRPAFRRLGQTTEVNYIRPVSHLVAACDRVVRVGQLTTVERGCDPGVDGIPKAIAHTHVLAGASGPNRFTAFCRPMSGETGSPRRLFEI